MRAKLTVRTIKDVVPGPKDIVIWDTELKGFGCKITPTGRKTFFYYYRTSSGQQRRPAIGTFGAIQPEAARNIAKAWAAMVAQGLDPSRDRAISRAMPTVGELCDRYLDEYAEGRKAPSSIANDKRLLDKRVRPALGSRKVDAVSRAEVERLHKSLRSTPFEANRTLALISKMFSLAEQWGLRPQLTNPARGIRRYREPGRERYLSAAEVKALWSKITEAESEEAISASAARALRLLVLTGRRVGEVLSLRWDQVDFDRDTIRFPETKTGSFVAPLSCFTKEYLRSEKRKAKTPFVCPSKRPDKALVNLQKPWRLVRQRAGLNDVRLHDLRHSYASLGAGLGMSLPMIGRLLGHSQAATTERYAHLAQDPVREAANRIEAEMLRRLA